MVRQLNFEFKTWWVCFEWSPRLRPVMGKQLKVPEGHVIIDEEVYLAIRKKLGHKINIDNDIWFMCGKKNFIDKKVR